MTMNEVYLCEGIEINQLAYPAKDGQFRYGRIRKEMRIYSPADWGTSEAKYSIVGIEINTWENTIEVQHLSGSMPYARNLFYALLADRDVRRIIANYQEKPRRDLYKIWRTFGMSGREDYFMTFGYPKGNFVKTRTIKLAHVSCFGKLNEGFGNKSKMYVGDFVELVSFMKLTEDMDVRSLRRKAKCKYIRPRFVEEISDFDTYVSKIL